MLSPESYRTILKANGFRQLPKDEDPFERRAFLEHPGNPKIVLQALLPEAGSRADETRLTLFTTFGSSPLYDPDPLNIVLGLERINDEALAAALVSATADRFRVLPVTG